MCPPKFIQKVIWVCLLYKRHFQKTEQAPNNPIYCFGIIFEEGQDYYNYYYHYYYYHHHHHHHHPWVPEWCSVRTLLKVSAFPRSAQSSDVLQFDIFWNVTESAAFPNDTQYANDHKDSFRFHLHYSCHPCFQVVVFGQFFLKPWLKHSIRYYTTLMGIQLLFLMSVLD